jgi:predicted PurR-regulated permease PerM
VTRVGRLGRDVLIVSGTAGARILGVPLALPLAVLTFIGGFVPIVGAFVAGAIAVLIVLVTILVVQQLEGNVLQPILQSRSLNLHGLGTVALPRGTDGFRLSGRSS